MCHDLLLLAFFAPNVFIGVFDALTLVGFRRTISADFSGRLSDFLFVRTFDGDMGLVGALDRDAIGDLMAHFVTEAKLHDQLFALNLSTIADTVDFQIAGITFRHANDKIVDNGTSRSPHLAGTDGIAARLHQHLVK